MSTTSAYAFQTVPSGRRLAQRRFLRLPMLFISWPQTDKTITKLSLFTPPKSTIPSKTLEIVPSTALEEKSPPQFKPTRATTSHPLARLGSPLRFCGLRPTKPSPDCHFSYPQDRRSPAKHWRSSPERRRKKSLRIPAESGRLCAAPTADLRSAQTEPDGTVPNKPERSEQPILCQTLAITLRPTASGVFP